ncbi:hypothetical protein KAT80_02620 [Candidatus Pacearchaeota archaeon]|nr:hypothetical protein [Candidatus Pacearchaeota archaeon]
MAERDVGKIKKNDTADIILRVDNFGNRKGLTIREFITSDRYTGFTKAGVKIMAADFPKFKEMINSVTEEDLKPEEEVPQESPAEQEKLPEAEKKETPKEGLPDY